MNSYPRDGGDSLTYLWKGKLATLGYSRQLPALKDVEDQTRLAGTELNKPEDWEYFANARTFGSKSPLYDLIAATSLATHWEIRYCCALSETVVLLVMTAAFAILLYTVVGPAAAGIGMTLLAFGVLPRQGISAFIPGTLALSVGMLLWAYVVKRRLRAHWIVLALFSAALALLHPIGKLYLAGALLMLGFYAWKAPLGRPERIRLLALFGAASVLPLVTPRLLALIFPGVEPIAQIASTPVSFGQGFLNNVWRAPKMLYDVIRKNWVFSVLLVMALYHYRSWFLNRRSQAPLLAMAALLAGSLFHNYVGFKAELFARLQVGGIVLIMGLVGRYVVRDLRSRFAWGIALAGLIATGVYWGHDYAFDSSFNYHPEVVYDKMLQQRMDELPPETSIAYLDANCALLSSLLSGGYRFHAYNQTTFPEVSQYAGLIQSNHVTLALTPNIKALNSVAMMQANWLVRKRQGLYLPAVDELEIESGRSLESKEFRLFFENHGKAFVCPVKISMASGTEMEGKFEVPAGQKGWVQITLPGNAFRTERIGVRLPKQSAWITGIATESPKDRIRWPWGSDVTLFYSPREARGPAFYRIQFSMSELLKDVNAEKLLPHLHGVPEVLSDDTGLVFLKINP